MAEPVNLQLDLASCSVVTFQEFFFHKEDI